LFPLNPDALAKELAGWLEEERGELESGQAKVCLLSTISPSKAETSSKIRQDEAHQVRLLCMLCTAPALSPG